MPTNDRIPEDVKARLAQTAPLQDIPAARSVTERIPDELLYRVEAVTSREDARQFARDAFDDEAAEVIVEQINAAVNLPWVGEAAEAIVLRMMLRLGLYLYHKAT